MRNKRPRASVDTAVVDVWQREVGELSNRKFAHRLASSEDLVLRLEIFKKLEKHQGCVNTVSFNADGHTRNIFHAKIMPYTDDRSLITCASDGQVRHAQLLERGVETRLLAKHEGQAHKFAIVPGSPHIFYTCGEDGLVQHIDLRTAAATKLFTCHPIDDSKAYMRIVPLNTLGIDPRNPNLFAVAGGIENDIKIWTPKAIDKAVLPTNIEQVLKRGLFYTLPFAAFYNDDDDFFGGVVDEYSDDDENKEEDESDDEYLDVYDDDDNYDDIDDDNSEDVEGGDDSDCSDDDNNDDFKPKPRGWMYRVMTPHDLMLQLFSLQRRGTSPEQNEENASAVGRELLDLMLAFNINSDNASDDPENSFS
ncbi:hypothetical protein V6N12_006506 [Hibiscus sabdariffa]|uniref:Uncharacterized protein n=1 Tax=Hibiscus sabdariffa TaxID=183260 RepID=A0ABR2EZ04_9ROSI